ncbi:MAG TPA: tagaturonate reductase [Candidatus Hydrogenedentes bacterium]|nr:tagaturonate reductase [Candidatus Hydrogenedentota bacterium]HOS03787.1 tagaturonate reductase [Candidatus Hydrogenedentota bacterium]
MERLNERTCGQRRCAADAPVRVLQFGEGNFLRAFVDWMFERLNRETAFRGRIRIVQPLPGGRVEALNEQDGLYAVLLRGLEAGRPLVEKTLITCVAGGINPFVDWAGFLEEAANPDLRFVVSNTTEAGIAFEAESFPEAGCPASFPAKVTALLWRRFQRFGGRCDKGLVFLPCELIDRNGDALKQCVLRHAAAWGLGERFAAWVDAACIFANTLVDRIVTGHPEGEEEDIWKELGFEDRMLVAGELFHLWVIEGPESLRDELPFREAGLNVVWTNDMEPYRTRKVRLLNGAHTASALAGFLAGHVAVGGMLKDSVLGPHIRRMMMEEIAPVVPLEDRDRLAYAEAVLDRFGNPFIHHRLLDIALNSVSKWRVRVLPSVLDNIRQRRCLPRRLAFSLAALMRFYCCEARADGTYWGAQGGEAYPVQDDPVFLRAFSEAWRHFYASGDMQGLVISMLRHDAMWGMNLTDVDGFSEVVAMNLRRILEHGVHEAVAALETEQT